jgi:ATP-binding cassette subfamily B protein
LTEVASPKITGWAIDILTGRTPELLVSTLQGQTTHQSMVLLLGLFAANLGLGFLFRTGWRQFIARRTHHSSYVFRLRYWSALRFVTPEVLFRHSLGDLIARGISDINPVRFVFGFSWALTLDLIFFLLVGTLAILVIDPVLAGLSLVGFPLAAYPVWRLSQRQSKQYRSAQESLGQLSQTINQAIATIRLQRATATEQGWQRELENHAEDFAAKARKSIMTFNHIIPFATFPTLIAYGVLAFYGVQRVQMGIITPGDLVTLFSLVLLMQNPLFELGPCIAEWQRGYVGLTRLNHIIGLATPKEYKLPPHSLPAEFAFTANGREKKENQKPASVLKVQDLNWQHPNGMLLFERRISMDILTGEKIGLMGPVGSGKTMLLEMLCGNLTPQSGKVMLSGYDLSSLSRQTLCEWITFVDQAPFLFSGTVRDNLSLDRDFSDEQLWNVIRLVGLHQDEALQRNGLDTMIGEFGINLSGGQKQRMCLARGLLRPAPLMIFDDCFSAMDTLTEEQILKNLLEPLRHCTVIWSAHRASTLRHCTRTLKLPEGRWQ